MDPNIFNSPDQVIRMKQVIIEERKKREDFEFLLSIKDKEIVEL
jgi:hypothetical protein